MRANAEEKYKKLTDDLSKIGIDVEIYPQGSFALGTDVRPYTDGKDVEYDLDFICEENLIKGNTNPAYVKNCIKNILEANGRNIKEDSTCWISEYADVQENIGFKMDIVPAVHEEDGIIQELKNKGVKPEYADDAIAITEKKEAGSYKWSYGNARGYTSWFEDINRLFKNHILQEKALEFKCSVEELPKITEKTALQRVVQILKRHRDIFCYNIKYPKISSPIITTLVAQIARSGNPSMNTYELLEYVIRELRIYSELMQKQSAEFINIYPNRLVIGKDKDTWVILNPVNPGNNYALGWSNKDAEIFFRWIDSLREDLIISSEYDNDKYYAGIKNSFGKEFVEKNLKEFAFIRPKETPVSVSEIKPWRS
jgi:hypothetical protein